MSGYTAPLADMRFALAELGGLPQLNLLPGLRDATPDVVDAVLEEAARLAGEVLAPLNRPGDTAGSAVRDGQVASPPGFADAYRSFWQAGWPALPFPPERGGQGLPELVATAVNEIWQAANMSFALCPMLTEGAVVTLEQHAAKELQERYLPMLISGEWTATMNLTEPQAGSDLGAVKMRAEPRSDHFLLSGQKIFITWGDQDFTDNIVHLVLARLPDAPPGSRGLSLFLVPKFLVREDGSLGERNDVHPVSIEHKMGIHASPTCVMSYGDHGGAIGYLIGKPHDGLSCMFTMMNHARLAVGVQGLSISERAYQQARGYARERVQGQAAGFKGSVTIVHHPDIRRMLMIMKAGVEAMRGLCYTTAASLDYLRHAADDGLRRRHEQRFALLTPIVKGWCTELSQEITSLGLQVHGGMGYVEETGAAQHFRDARITTIYEGTTGIQAGDLVGRKLIRDGGRVMGILIAEMKQAADALLETRDAALAAVAKRLAAGVVALERATRWLLDHHAADASIPGAASVDYLMLAGTVCGAWQMARASLAVMQDGYDARLRQAKLVTARFYMEHLLPRSQAYFESIQAGHESIMALGEDQF
ncbi:MAG: acyl-CoA dehydrogenase [Gammaproteobacteria bacterium]|nr:acyl-CoA dehydrogenase [Gammaproteobacteria bacterium]